MKKVVLLVVAMLLTLSTATYAGGPMPVCPPDNPDCLPR
jgi:hypothetical protein